MEELSYENIERNSKTIIYIIIKDKTCLYTTSRSQLNELPIVMFLKVGKDSENISVWLYVYYMAANTRMIQSRPNYLGRARLREMLIPNMVMPNCSYIKIELLLGW